MRKKIVFLKHIKIEGPGTLGAFFKKSGFDIQEIELQDGAQAPSDLTGIAALIILGGPMNVYEEEKFPFLKNENALIQKALAHDVPLLGICLGAQLLAKACGAKVGKSPSAEIGFFDLSLTEDGLYDFLFENVEPPLKVFQWHEDMFDIPQKGRWLASSQGCSHQAFRVNKKAYGLQFHVEVDRAMITAWMKAYWKLDNVWDHDKACDILAQYDEAKAKLDQAAEQMYANFLSIIV